MNLLMAIMWVVGIQLLDNYIERRFACDCGRSRPWYYAKSHARGGVFLGRAMFGTAMVLFCIFVNYPIMGAILAMLNVWSWRAWWFHEKDKLKKKAAKAAGVVAINKHGRLVVKPVKL